jgi:Flp pilus assembly protein TadB
MTNILFFLLLSVVLLITVTLFNQQKLRQAAARRLFEEEKEGNESFPRSREFNYLKRYRWIHLVLAGISFCIFFWFLHLKIAYALAFSFIVFLLAGQIEDIRIIHHSNKLEEQLADAIDLMISGLQAGSSAVGVMEYIQLEIGEPLKSEFREIAGRLRFGDNPQEIFKDLGYRIPLESFKIFSLTMSVHWGTGGRLVPLLSTVSKTIRDRVEIARQIRLQSIQAKLSTLILLFCIYFIALIVWKTAPQNMTAFLNSTTGGWAAVAAIVLQGFGIVWISNMSKVKY